MEFSLLWAALLAVGSLYAVLYWEARRGNAAACSRSLWDVALTAILAGVAVGRLWAMMADGVNPIAHPGDILIVRAGVATGPAAVAALAVAAWLGRSEPLRMADGLAAAALAGLAGWHAGCLFRDACLGTQSGLPWAVTQAPGGATRHPVEIYAALALAAAAVALAVWKRSGRPVAGVPAALALGVAGAVRLLTEPLRPALGPGPVWWYAAAVALGIAAAATISMRRRGRAGPAD